LGTLPRQARIKLAKTADEGADTPFEIAKFIAHFVSLFTSFTELRLERTDTVPKVAQVLRLVVIAIGRERTGHHCQQHAREYRTEYKCASGGVRRKAFHRRVFSRVH
jgi:hypothetical protein